MSEIAKVVGVSKGTVSRVLNYDPTLSISAQKRKAIIETAEALNYAAPRDRARPSRQGVNKIALVHFLGPDQELANPYYVTLRLGIESSCSTLGIDTIKLYQSSGGPDAAMLQDASGVIAIGPQEPDRVEWLVQHSKNIVFADFHPRSDDLDCVWSDYAAAMFKLLHALHDKGYRHLAYVGWNDDRAASFVKWTREHAQYHEHWFRTGDSTEEGGYFATKGILESEKLPEAVVCFNDNMAVGAYRAIREKGLRIPEDISVTGFNDISVAQFLDPPLTTVRLPAGEIGEAATTMLMELCEGRTYPKQTSLASRLIWRDSTRDLSQ